MCVRVASRASGYDDSMPVGMQLAVNSNRLLGRVQVEWSSWVSKLGVVACFERSFRRRENFTRAQRQ
jgi:hypothetical protein